MSPITWHPTTPQEKQSAPIPPQSGWAVGNPWFGISMGLLGVIAGYAANIYAF